MGDGYNLYIPLGTRIIDVLNYLNIDEYKVAKVISGGPMMGTSAADLYAPVVKGTSGLLLLDEKEAVRRRNRPAYAAGGALRYVR